MANSKLLKEAIADAKAVRETAIANAKIALEEAFAPRLQAALSKKIQAEMEDMDDEEEVNEEYSDGSEAPDEDASDIGTGDNKQPADDANSSSELAQGNPDTEVETSEVGKEEEDYDVVSEGDEDELPGEEPSKLEEEEEEDEDEFDLAEIIRELESELEEEDGEEMHEEEEDEMHEEESEEAPVAEEEDEMHEEESEEEMHEEDEIDLDEILREMGYGDDEEMTKEEEENGEDMAAEMAEKEAELDEAYKVIKSLKKTINEVNLLNAKLLYTNKLFRSYNLTTEQKHKVVETLDRTGNVREVKLVFSTLAESLKMGGTSKKVKQAKLTESFASKPVASTAPKKEIISESNQLAERFKQLANIK
jgi:outer membrane lipopolysaccharide assembly protein LptE/RlpB